MKKNKIQIPLLLTREDHAPKPAPDALLHIAKYWQVATTNILCVGDHFYDSQAAKNANMNFCLVTNGNKLNFEHSADITVQNLIELQQLLAHN